ANKLVETFKSKVKALVGAFESVISLQERNGANSCKGCRSRVWKPRRSCGERLHQRFSR
ncbi:unnamed protein product, partial [Brassica rapa subsp. trilocularis]